MSCLIIGLLIVDSLMYVGCYVHVLLVGVNKCTIMWYY